MPAEGGYHGQAHWNREAHNGAEGGRQNGNDGGAVEEGEVPQDADKIRRQRAKGRYRPY